MPYARSYKAPVYHNASLIGNCVYCQRWSGIRFLSIGQIMFDKRLESGRLDVFCVDKGGILVGYCRMT